MSDMSNAPTLVLHSTETKPTVAGGYPKPQQGTTILEENTGKVYIYNTVSDSWGEI